MKNTKMSQRSHGAESREMARNLQSETLRAQGERLEQQRIDFERRSHLVARAGLYGSWPTSGLLDSKHH